MEFTDEARTGEVEEVGWNISVHNHQFTVGSYRARAPIGYGLLTADFL